MERSGFMTAAAATAASIADDIYIIHIYIM